MPAMMYFLLYITGQHGTISIDAAQYRLKMSPLVCSCCGGHALWKAAFSANCGHGNVAS